MDSIYFPLDRSGKAPSNKVANEPHVLVNRPVRIAVPDYGAFFVASLIVKDADTGKTLTSQQYRAGEMLAEETKKYGRRICTIVLITDPAVSNNITITYQAMGRWDSYSKKKLIEALTQLGSGEENVRWEDIIDKPERFNPAPHLHHVSEVYGTEYLEDAIHRMQSASSVGEDAARLQVTGVIQNLRSTSATHIKEGVDALMAGHIANADPHPQFAKKSDLVTTLPAVRRPKALVPANGATGVKLETPFEGSHYYSLFGIALKQAQIHVALSSDFTDIQFLATVDASVQSYQPPELLQGSKRYYWRFRYTDVEGAYSDWSAAAAFDTVPPYPAAGTLLRTYCKDIQMWHVYADGRNGEYEQLWEEKSLECGYIPPIPYGTLLRTYCQGVEKWGAYADGNYGEYQQVIDPKSLECGYVPPIPYGTELRRFCKGVDLWGIYANGNYGEFEQIIAAKSGDCGYVPPTPPGTELGRYCKPGTTELWGTYADGNYGQYDQLIQPKSIECGYIPPPAAGTELRRYCEYGTFTLHVVYADGLGGETDIVKEINSLQCGYVPPPAAGTVLATYCKGTDKYQRIANGDGTDHEQLLEQNSLDCGYVPPPQYPPQGTVIGYTCVEYDKYNKIADGNGGYTTVLVETNATICGYSPPAAGTVLNQYCQGFDLWRTYADGNGGSYNQLYQTNSPTCGYTPPPVPSLAKPTWWSPNGVVLSSKDAALALRLNPMVINNNDGTVAYGGSRCNVYDSDGNLVYDHVTVAGDPGSISIPSNALQNHKTYTVYAHYYATSAAGQINSPYSDAVSFITGWDEYPPAGTVLSVYCQEYDKYQSVADGNGGSYAQLLEAKSAYCGYVNPFSSGINNIPANLYSYSPGSMATMTFRLNADGTWAIAGQGTGDKTPSQSGRFLNGNAAGFEAMVMVDYYNNPDNGFVNSSIPHGTWGTLSSGLLVDSRDSSPDDAVNATVTINVRQANDPSVATTISFSLVVDGRCFALGTVLHTPLGDRLVDDLVEGDMVSSFSEPTMLDSSVHNWESWTVENISRVSVNEVSSVRQCKRFVLNKSVKLNGLHSTLTHTHFVYDKALNVYRWKEAGDVVVGDAFVSMNRELIPVISVKRIDVPTTFVALNVEDLDTLEVKLGDKYILTHNLS